MDGARRLNVRALDLASALLRRVLGPTVRLYVNRLTDERSWQKPADYDGD